MKKYSVIQSEQGSVGRPKGFDTLNEATSFYDKCDGGAVLVLRAGQHEIVFKYKGLDFDSVKALMGW